MHHRGPFSQVSPESDPVGVGDPYARGNYEVGHSGKLVHTIHAEVVAAGCRSGPRRADLLREARPQSRPSHIFEYAKDAIHENFVGAKYPMAQ